VVSNSITMSKFKVKASYGNVNKFVEMDRSSNYSVQMLNNSLRNLFKVNNFTIAYNAPNGNFVYIKTDEQLKHAVEEISRSRQKNIDLKVIGEGGNYTPPSYNRTSSPPKQRTNTSSQPTSSPSYSSSPSPSYSNSNSNSSPSYSSPSPSTTAYEEPPLTSFTCPADRNTTSVKVRVQANPSYDHFLFSCTPSKYDTTVNVFIEEGSKLVFKCVHLEGHTQVRLTQSFQLPFPISTGKIEYINTHHGQDVRVNM